jgi:hypothetical protein
MTSLALPKLASLPSVPGNSVAAPAKTVAFPNLMNLLLGGEEAEPLSHDHVGQGLPPASGHQASLAGEPAKPFAIFVPTVPTLATPIGRTQSIRKSSGKTGESAGPTPVKKENTAPTVIAAVPQMVPAPTPLPLALGLPAAPEAAPTTLAVARKTGGSQRDQGQDQDQEAQPAPLSVAIAAPVLPPAAAPVISAPKTAPEPMLQQAPAIDVPAPSTARQAPYELAFGARLTRTEAAPQTPEAIQTPAPAHSAATPAQTIVETLKEAPPAGQAAPAQPAAQPEAAAQPAKAAAIAVKAVVKPETPEDRPAAPETGKTSFTAAVSATPGHSDPGPSAAKEDVKAQHALPIPEPEPARKTEPVRDLTFKIDQVEIKVQDRAGEVRVSVHSANPELTAGMRQQLGDLAQRLDHGGYHSETWKPTPETAAAPASQNRDLPGNQQQSQQQQEQQQQSQRQKKSKQPQWLQEMNHSLNPPLEGTPRI